MLNCMSQDETRKITFLRFVTYNVPRKTCQFADRPRSMDRLLSTGPGFHSSQFLELFESSRPVEVGCLINARRELFPAGWKIDGRASTNISLFRRCRGTTFFPTAEEDRDASLDFNLSVDDYLVGEV